MASHKPLVVSNNTMGELAVGDTLDVGGFAQRPSFAGATPYDNTNLTAGVLNGLHGYVPARPSTSFGGAVSGTANLSVNSSYAVVTSVSFVATGATALLSGGGFVSNGANGSATAVDAYLKLTDVTSNSVVGTGPIDHCVATATGGGKLAPSYVVSGLTPGDTYRVEIWATAESGNQTTMTNMALEGISL